MHKAIPDGISLLYEVMVDEELLEVFQVDINGVLQIKFK